MIEDIAMLKESVGIWPIIVTDIKNAEERDKLNTLTDGRIFFVQRSGWAMSALLCNLPL